MRNIQAIFWDFDGVLMDSNGVRDLGFDTVLRDFPRDQIEKLQKFHKANGGLSRYVKFRYFFEVIRKEEVTELQIAELSAKFSAVMRENLINPSLLVSETLDFVKRECQKIPMHIVSGSDEDELRGICKAIEIDQYFRSIHGSPTPKTRLVERVLLDFKYCASDCLLIGDSINDFEAAMQNKVKFMAYNNNSISHLSSCSLVF